MATPADRSEPQGWFKSSHSTNANACVEVRFTRAGIQVRDSKRHAGTPSTPSPAPVLTISSDQWQNLIHNLGA